MTPSLMLFLGSAVCALGVLLFSSLAIKYRNEDFVLFLIVAAIACVAGATSTFRESVKKAEDEQRIPVDVQPGQQ
jgi:membrane protein implicated in regulation of membrane protease activity